MDYCCIMRMMQGSDHGEPHSLVVVDDVGEEFGGG